MRLPVDEKNLVDMQSVIKTIFGVGEKTEQFTVLNIYKAYSTNARAI